jgi:hypothetical protein
VTSVAQAGTAPDRRPIVYLLLQAVVVFAWWVAVIASHPVREWFFPYGGLDPAFVAFLLPDVVFIIGGSLVVARRRARGDAPGRAAASLLGAVGYATLYTLGWTFLVRAPPASAVARALLAIGTWRACRD